MPWRISTCNAPVIQYEECYRFRCPQLPKLESALFGESTFVQELREVPKRKKLAQMGNVVN